jgi:hypothetical protein
MLTQKLRVDRWVSIETRITFGLENSDLTGNNIYDYFPLLEVSLYI